MTVKDKIECLDLSKKNNSITNSIVNAFNHASCLSRNNQQCMTQAPLINLHPNEHSPGLRYYPFVVNLDRCVRCCNTLTIPSNRVCVRNKTEDLAIYLFNSFMTLG